MNVGYLEHVWPSMAIAMDRRETAGPVERTGLSELKRQGKESS